MATHLWLEVLPRSLRFVWKHALSVIRSTLERRRSSRRAPWTSSTLARRRQRLLPSKKSPSYRWGFSIPCRTTSVKMSTLRSRARSLYRGARGKKPVNTYSSLSSHWWRRDFSDWVIQDSGISWGRPEQGVHKHYSTLAVHTRASHSHRARWHMWLSWEI